MQAHQRMFTSSYMGKRSLQRKYHCVINENETANSREERWTSLLWRLEITFVFSEFLPFRDKLGEMKALCRLKVHIFSLILLNNYFKTLAIINWKKKYNIVGLVLKSNGKIVETGKINTPITLTCICYCLLPWLMLLNKIMHGKQQTPHKKV